MKLSMSMVESRLGNYAIESTIQDDERTISGMRFISEQQSVHSRDTVYIGRADQFFEDPRYAEALVLASGKSSIVCLSSDYEALLNDVLRAFDFFNDAEQRLLNVASQHLPLAEMLKIVSEMLPDPLIVFAIDGSVLGTAHADRLDPTSSWTAILGQDNLGASTLGRYFVGEDGTVYHDLSDVPLSMADSSGEFAVSMYLYHGEEAIGFVVCAPRSRSGELLALAIEPAIACYLAQALEFTSALSPYQSRRTALKELMDGAEVPREVASRIAETIGSSTKLRIVSVGSLTIQNRTQRMMLMREIEGSEVPCVACEDGDAVVFLVANSALEALLQEIAVRFDAKNMSVGVSMEIAEFEGVSSASRQATFAREASHLSGIRYCRDLALPFLLGAIRKEAASRDLLHPAINTLEAYDRDNRTDLLATLRAYVECGCNQAETAKHLFVHLNTLKYRLRRISELTGIDFKDHDVLFYLELSLRL